MATKKDHFGEVLERNGVKYFLGISAFLYILGTVIFNIYLKKLGSFEFNLLQLRYMFVGIAFVLITSVLPFLIWSIYGIARVIRGPEPQPKKKLAPMQKAKITRARNEKQERLFNRWKLAFMIFLPVWIATYAWLVFPEIPSGFGGAKPYAARLIGTEEAIQKINDQIAFEAGVQTEKLPFELLPGTSGLTTGANVLILDKSDSRIFLLLTRDLYLSSTSDFAKKMLELGKMPEELESADTESFQVKPLIVSAEGIDGITLSLYEPLVGTTTEDLQLAAEIVAANPDRAQEVSDAISEDLPGVGEKIVAAVQQHQNTLPPDTVNPVTLVDPVISLEEVINEVIEESVDTTFLDFRALSFAQATALIDTERRSGVNSENRRVLIQSVTEGLKKDFPDAWAQLDPITNFLVIGQTDPDFAKKIKEAFRGADNAETVMTRLNTTEKTEENPFTEVRAGALELLQNSSQTNTQGNREFVAQSLQNYFNNKSPRRRWFWEEGYMLDTGVGHEKFFENLEKVFTDPTDWDEFKTLLVDFETKMNETCEDGILNQDETAIDCGGVCEACVVVPLATCEDGILNQDETEIDCGGVCEACVVVPVATCEDGILNQDEIEIDCGGVCDACVVVPVETCTDGILNQDETAIDCGGAICEACVVVPVETCEDGILNQDETEIDCGGAICDACVVVLVETCADGILNQDETEIDCGGTVCEACVVVPTCTDTIQNGDETGVDCGGICLNACE